MRPVADALDMLQADKHISIGYLLPTITVLKNELRKVESSLKHCKVLVESLHSSINLRFGPDFEERELRLAAMTHPCFKLSWVPEEEKESSELFFEMQ